MKNQLNKNFINVLKIKTKIIVLKYKSKDFECCLDVLNEVLKELD
jgi:hypothetical protein